MFRWDSVNFDDAGASPRHCGSSPPVYRDENDEEQSSSALQAHTLVQRDQRLVNPEGWWTGPSFPRRRESTGRR